MRDQDQATDDSKYHVAQLVDSLQDADVDSELIRQAEELQSEVSEL